MNTFKLDIIQSKKMNDILDNSTKKFENKNLLDENYYDSYNDTKNIENINLKNTLYEIDNNCNNDNKNLKTF